MAQLELVLALLVVVAALAAGARRIGIPSPIAMVVGGIAIGAAPGLPHVELAPEIVFVAFLPPLLYGAAVTAPLRDYRANAAGIALLAFGLVLVTAAAVAVAARALLPALGWAEAFALGAIVAPPDAVAATSILQRVGVPRRILAILEGESLLNDATALVAYRLALVAAATGEFSGSDAALRFLLVAAGGTLVGLVAGYVAQLARVRVADTPVSITVSLLTPFAAYLAAEQLGVSGVLAVVVAGLWIGRAISRLSSEERVVGGAVWQMISFVLNGLLFTLVGLQLPRIVATLGADAPGLTVIGLAIAAVVIAVRFAWCVPAAYLARVAPAFPRDRLTPSWRSGTVVSWAGMRGAVSLAAALALPLGFAGREALVFVTFCVIVVTLVGQGLTLAPLARALGVVAGADVEHEEAHARAATAEAALELIPSLRERWSSHLELVDRLETEYRHRALHADEHHDDGALGEAERELVEHRAIAREMIEAERAAAHEMHAREAISDEVLRRIERDLDLAELRGNV